MNIPKPMTVEEVCEFIIAETITPALLDSRVVVEQHRRDMWGMVAWLRDMEYNHPKDPPGKGGIFAYGGPSNCEYGCLPGVADLLEVALQHNDVRLPKEGG